ncbi:MAG TPA: hypothetical protein VGI48_18510 [Caldimonas sp.]|jgi:hypothetical protein
MPEYDFAFATKLAAVADQVDEKDPWANPKGRFAPFSPPRMPNATLALSRVQTQIA